MDNNELEKMRDEELKKNPTGTFNDALNRSMVGDPGALFSGGCLSRILTLIVVIIGLLILAKFFN